MVVDSWPPNTEVQTPWLVKPASQEAVNAAAGTPVAAQAETQVAVTPAWPGTTAAPKAAPMTSGEKELVQNYDRIQSYRQTHIIQIRKAVTTGTWNVTLDTAVNMMMKHVSPENRWVTRWTKVVAFSSKVMKAHTLGDKEKKDLTGTNPDDFGTPSEARDHIRGPNSNTPEQDGSFY